MCVLCAYRSAEVPFGSLNIDRREIFLMMGSAGYIPDADMRERVEKTIEEIATFCRPCYGYSVFRSESVGEESVSLSGRILNVGRTIAGILKDADLFVLMVATSGMEFENWYRKEARSGDILREFTASNIGSEIAEAAGRAALAAIEAEFAAKGLKTGNSYAPGYCGWGVSDQQTLFSLLPPRPCGITLNSSCLMMPIKSISGIVPVGAVVSKKAYGCAICDRTDCYKEKRL